MKKIILTILMICAGCGLAVDLVLPAPTDLEPAAVKSQETDSGQAVISGNAPDGAPAISAISENTLPNETLVMSGYNLKGADLIIWSQGMISRVKPLASEADRMTAVVPPDMPEAVMLVWPHKDGLYGSPIRVNGAAAQWCLPETVAIDEQPKTVKVMGKNFVIGSFKPSAYIRGEKYAGFADIKECNPYKVEIEINNLPAGEYKIWLHNGSGGDWGWSEPVAFSVTADVRRAPETIYVKDFGAIAGDRKDDTAAIAAAVDKAAAMGGAVIEFEQGRYFISTPIIVGADNIHLRGRGMGEYRNGEETVTGEFTLLRYFDTAQIPQELIRFDGAYCSIKNMTVINAADGEDRNVLVFNKPNITVDKIRVIMFDKRNWGYKTPGPWQAKDAQRDMRLISRKIIDKGAILIDTEGAANIYITNSQVHAVGPGVQVGKFTGWETSKSKPLSESVLIENVEFTGYYSGEPDGKSNAGASGRATGVVLYSGRKIAVENCRFRSADRFNAKIMGRTILAFNSYGRYYYFADNRSENVGPHPSAEGMDTNQGEQYLIHYRNLHGGLFDVVAAKENSLTITTANIGSFDNETKKNATTAAQKKAGQNWDTKNPHFYYDSRGSQVLDEVKDDKNWILYVSKGKGAGQYRAITDFIKNDKLYTFKVERDWRVVPDSASRVHLMPAYRYITIYNNYVDTGKLIEETKTHGVCLWFYNFDNIIANNTFRNMTSGIIINSRFSGPTGWNTTRGNVIENIHGYAGDTSEIAAGYVDHFRLTLQWPAVKDRLWYQVGNVFRDNTIKNASVGVYLHTRYTGFVRTVKPQTVEHTDSGIMMSVIENNTITDVKEGIVLSSPVNTSVVRGNIVETTGNAHPPIYSQDGQEGLVNVVIEEQK